MASSLPDPTHQQSPVHGLLSVVGSSPTSHSGLPSRCPQPWAAHPCCRRTLSLGLKASCSQRWAQSVPTSFNTAVPHRFKHHPDAPQARQARLPEPVSSCQAL